MSRKGENIIGTFMSLLTHPWCWKLHRIIQTSQQKYLLIYSMIKLLFQQNDLKLQLKQKPSLQTPKNQHPFWAPILNPHLHFTSPTITTANPQPKPPSKVTDFISSLLIFLIPHEKQPNSSHFFAFNNNPLEIGKPDTLIRSWNLKNSFDRRLWNLFKKRGKIKDCNFLPFYSPPDQGRPGGSHPRWKEE